MKTLKILGFEHIEREIANSEVYIVKIENDGEILDQKVEIDNNGIRLVKRGELEVTIGTKPAAMITRKLLNYIDGEKINFPFEIQVDGAKIG